MVKVDNAIIMAAGMSSRLYPLTLNKPKGMIEVKSEILIERLIKQLKEKNINEIIIVVGHFKEKYYYLKKKYGVIILDNPYYKEMNNYSSLYIARNYLKNSYICTSDIYYTENIFNEFENISYYLSEYHKGNTKEWCLEVDSNGIIIGFSVGGRDSWVLSGHAFLSEKFSDYFKIKLEQNFNEGIKNNYFWEEIYFENIDKLKLNIKKINKELLYEFDSLDELREFDLSYINDTKSDILKDVAEKLDISESQIIRITPIGIREITGFSFFVNNKKMNYNFKNHSLYK